MHGRRRGSTTLVIALVALCAVILAPPARSESPYELKDSREYAWVGGGVALCAGGWFTVSRVDPLTSAQVAALNVNDINSFDRNSMQPYRNDHAGDALAVGSFALPFAFLARDDMRSDATTLGVIWAEATLWNAGLFELAKGLTTRTRPYAYDANAPADLKTKKDARVSFYSGHAATAAMNSFLMAKVFSDYSSNRNAEIAMWSGAVVPIEGLLVACNNRTDSGSITCAMSPQGSRARFRVLWNPGFRIGSMQSPERARRACSALSGLVSFRANPRASACCAAPAPWALLFRAFSAGGIAITFMDRVAKSRAGRLWRAVLT